LVAIPRLPRPPFGPDPRRGCRAEGHRRVTTARGTSTTRQTWACSRDATRASGRRTKGRTRAALHPALQLCLPPPRREVVARPLAGTCEARGALARPRRSSSSSRLEGAERGWSPTCSTSGRLIHLEETRRRVHPDTGASARTRHDRPCPLAPRRRPQPAGHRPRPRQRSNPRVPARGPLRGQAATRPGRPAGSPRDLGRGHIGELVHRDHGKDIPDPCSRRSSSSAPDSAGRTTARPRDRWQGSAQLRSPARRGPRRSGPCSRARWVSGRRPSSRPSKRPTAGSLEADHTGGKRHEPHETFALFELLRAGGRARRRAHLEERPRSTARLEKELTRDRLTLGGRLRSSSGFMNGPRACLLWTGHRARLRPLGSRKS